MQRQVVLKLKVLGMNAAFGYSCRIQVGSDIVIATVVCTAVYLESLPPPQPLQVTITRMKDKGSVDQDARLTRLQRDIEELTLFNKTNLESLASDKKLQSQQQNQQLQRTAVGSFDSSPEGVGKRSKISEWDGGVIHGEDNEVSQSSVASSSSSSSSSEESNEDSSLESPPSSTDSSDEEDSDGSSAGDDKELSDSKHGIVDAPQPAEKGNKSRLITGQPQMGTSRMQISTSPSGEGDRKVKRRVKRVVFKDDRPPFILELDDETDVDISAVLSDWVVPIGFDMVNISFVPGCWKAERPSGLGRNLVIMRRGKLSSSKAPVSVLRAINSSTNRSKTGGIVQSGPVGPLGGSALTNLLNKLFQEAYLRLCFSVKDMTPCQVLGIHQSINILEEGLVEVLLTAMVHKTEMSLAPINPSLGTDASSGDMNTPPLSFRKGSKSSIRSESFDNPRQLSASSFDRAGIVRNGSISSNDSLFALYSSTQHQPDGNLITTTSSNINDEILSRRKSSSPETAIPASPASDSYNIQSRPQVDRVLQYRDPPFTTSSESHIMVTLTPLCCIPGTKVIRYLGPIQLHFIKDHKDVWDSKQVSGSFFYQFLSEANAVARAQVAALGEFHLCIPSIFNWYAMHRW